MPNLLRFEDAIQQARNSGRNPKLRVILGNGFSRACRNDLFAYDALFERARDSLSPTAKQSFEALGTTDFESVMRSLKQAETLIGVYAPNRPKLARKLRKESESLREILASVIAANHPERMSEIEDDEFRSCRHFLNYFGDIYTLNYDLLLYWSLMKQDIDDLTITCSDGFRYPDGVPDEYVAWDLNAANQNIHYLHGALHIFDAGSEIQKYTWSNTGIALVDQIRDALEESYYPIYVAEGTSKSKWTRILHNSFLFRGYRSLSNIGGALFIFGHSLHDNDNHVLKCIEQSTVGDVFVSIYGNPKSPDNRRIVDSANALSHGRLETRRQKELKVHFFDAESANVWG